MNKLKKLSKTVLIVAATNILIILSIAITLRIYIHNDSKREYIENLKNYKTLHHYHKDLATCVTTQFKDKESGNVWFAFYHPIKITMDIQMPIMNGYEATAAIRSLNRQDAKWVPIIAMSANAFAEDVQMARNAGMNAHLAKPVEINSLKDLLKKYFE